MVQERLERSLNKYGVMYRNIQKMVGDASTRVYFRVFLEQSSSVAMVLPEKVESNEGGSFKLTEEPFYQIQNYLKEGNLPVPEIFWYDIDNRIMLLEDLGDKTLFRAVTEDDIDLERHYKNVIKTLILFQKHTQKERKELYPFQREFNFETLLWELEHFVEWYIYKGENKELSESEKLIVNAEFQRIAMELSQIPKIVCHRDYQSKNIMIHNKKLYLIDFQDALMGSPVYDLVALLKDSYISMEEDFVVDMLKYYLKKSESTIEFESFYRMFKLQAVQRKLKDTGRFHFIDQVRGNSSFLQYIPLSKLYILRYLEEISEPLYKIFSKHL